MTELNAKRVVVTGASGFIGRQTLAPLISRGYEVHAVSRKGDFSSHDGVVPHRADLFHEDEVRDLLATVRPSHLLHLAWDVSPGAFWSSLENFRWVEASLKLVGAFRDAGGQRFVIAGTCAEYDWTGDCCSAATPVRPATVYGICKNALRELVAAYASATSMSFAWGRIFHLFGPFEHPARLVPSIITGIARHEPVDCTDGMQQRDFLHVRDVASAFAALLDSEVTGVVDIGSGTAIPVRDLIDRIAGQMNGTDYVRLGVRNRPRGEPLVIRADAHRLNDEVGWSPALQWPDAIDETIAWWKTVLENPA